MKCLVCGGDLLSFDGEIWVCSGCMLTVKKEKLIDSNRINLRLDRD